LEQQFHTSALKTMKMRTGENTKNFMEGDELILLFDDKVSVCIDGSSLWKALQSELLQEGKKFQLYF